MTGLANDRELQEFLARHPQIDAVQIFLTDACGVARGKLVRRHELAAIFANGRQVAGSILGLDVTGMDVDGTGLVWDTGDADMVCRPVAGTLMPVTWLPVPSGQLMLTMFDRHGSPAPADPRHALARAVDRLQSLGYAPVLACEIEFYLLHPDTLQPAGGGRANERQKIDAYSLTRLDDLAPLFADVFAAAAAQGLPAETLMSEYASGQFEITLRHRRDALRAVDEAILFKRLLRGVAARHGLLATFMAKPFAESAGSGLHLHLSLARHGSDAAENLCAADDPAGSELLRHMIGGLKATMADGFAMFAPNANSYRRFQSASYAPMSPIWGINNRSVSLRVPAGPPESRHVEHRVAGADANLYLAAAAVLAGAARGIREKLDPGPPVTGNGYAQALPREFPATWQEALDRAEKSAFLREALGARTLEIFIAIKRQECARFSAQVTELDYAWYARSV
jgi:glutamine synthetase